MPRPRGRKLSAHTALIAQYFRDSYRAYRAYRAAFGQAIHREGVKTLTKRKTRRWEKTVMSSSSEPSRKWKVTRDVTRSPWMTWVTSPMAMVVPSMVLRARKPCAEPWVAHWNRLLSSENAVRTHSKLAMSPSRPDRRGKRPCSLSPVAGTPCLIAWAHFSAPRSQIRERPSSLPRHERKNDHEKHSGAEPRPEEPDTRKSRDVEKSA